MLKTIAISAWATIFTLGVFYFTLPSADPTGSMTTTAVPLEEIRTEPLSIAIFKRGNVVGHLATRVRYKLPVNTLDQFPIPVSHMIGDGLYEVIYGMKISDLTKLTNSDLAQIGEKLGMLLQERRTPLPIRDVRLENTRVVLK